MTVWKAIPNWPYEASDDGRVRNAVTLHEIAIAESNSGYLNCTLSNSPRLRRAGVHQFVAEAFLGPKPAIGFEVCHGDGNAHNNSLSNLRWASKKENMLDRDRHGNTLRGLRNGNAKHSDETVRGIINMSKAGASLTLIAKVTGVPRGTAHDYIVGSTRKVSS